MLETWVRFPGLRSSLEKGRQPILVFYFESPMDRGARQAIVHGVSDDWVTFALQGESNYQL